MRQYARQPVCTCASSTQSSLARSIFLSIYSVFRFFVSMLALFVFSPLDKHGDNNTNTTRNVAKNRKQPPGTRSRARTGKSCGGGHPPSPPAASAQAPRGVQPAAHPQNRWACSAAIARLPRAASTRTATTSRSGHRRRPNATAAAVSSTRPTTPPCVAVTAAAIAPPPRPRPPVQSRGCCRHSESSTPLYCTARDIHQSVYEAAVMARERA